MKKGVVTATVTFLFLLLLVSALMLGCVNPDATGISGKSVLKSKAQQAESAADAAADSAVVGCSANICIKHDIEVYCPDTLSQCKEKYSSCKRVLCDDGAPVWITEAPTATYDNPETDGAYAADGSSGSSDSLCTEQYNDCYSDGEAVTCKGSFVDCAASFDDCICGSREEQTAAGGEEATPTEDYTQKEECATGIYVCEKEGFAIDGTPTKSQVTCKGSIQQCSIVYGACKCGDASLLDFPTIIEGTNVDADPADYCDFYGDKVLCNEMNKTCHLSNHRCKTLDGRWLECEGSFTFCNTKYGGRCLCGVEQKGYS